MIELLIIALIISIIIVFMFYVVLKSTPTIPTQVPTQPVQVPIINDPVDITDPSPVVQPTPSPVTTQPVPSPVPTEPVSIPIIAPIIVPIVNMINNYRKVINTDMFGFDLPNGGLTDKTVEQCAETCNNTDNCAFFTYHVSGKDCWLKGPTPQEQNSITGLKRGDGTYTIYPKADVYGLDIQRYSGVSQSLCETNCENNPDCDLYYYNSGSCWLKSGNDKQGYDTYFRKLR